MLEARRTYLRGSLHDILITAIQKSATVPGNQVKAASLKKLANKYTFSQLREASVSGIISDILKTVFDGYELDALSNGEHFGVKAPFNVYKQVNQVKQDSELCLRCFDNQCLRVFPCRCGYDDK